MIPCGPPMQALRETVQNGRILAPYGRCLASPSKILAASKVPSQREGINCSERSARPFPAADSRAGVRAGAVSPPAWAQGTHMRETPEAIGERMRAS